MIKTTFVPDAARAQTEKREPVEIIRDLLLKKYPAAPVPKLKSCKLYYGRFAVADSSGNLGVAYFPPEFDYVLDFGYETLVVFRTVYKAIGAGDPTFPHWELGHFFCATSEKQNDILFPSHPQDLLVATDGIDDADLLQKKIASTGCQVHSKVGKDMFLVKALPYQENRLAADLQKVQGIRYADRNWVLRIIDGYPGWILDRVF